MLRFKSWKCALGGGDRVITQILDLLYGSLFAGLGRACEVSCYHDSANIHQCTGGWWICTWRKKRINFLGTGVLLCVPFFK